MRSRLLSCWSELYKRLPKHYRLLMLSLVTQRRKVNPITGSHTGPTGLQAESVLKTSSHHSRGHHLASKEGKHQAMMLMNYDNNQHGIIALIATIISDSGVAHTH